MQGQRLAAVPGDNVLEQTMREALAATVCAGDDAADQMTGILIARLRGFVDNDPQVGSRAERINDPYVLSGLVAIAFVELRLINALLKKEHFGAQPGKLEELVSGQLAPGSLNR